MKQLRISEDLNLPIDAVTGTFCIVGIRGSGKSTTAVDMAEEMLKAKQQIVVLDPKDDWWGIRASADRQSEGYPVTIFGGTHQDAPLEYAGGALLAEMILTERISAIISTKHLSDGHRYKFTYDFCDYLYKHCSEPMHLFIDEADQFAPQERQTRIQKGDNVSEAMMLNLVRRVIKQGRTSGLGSSLITQSPATLDKRVMNMCETLIAMRVVGAQDFAAVETWFKVYLRKKDDLETTVSQLPTLRAGQGVFYSPAWLEVSKVVQFRMAETFDSRKTPKVGERRIEPKVLAPVDLKRLSESMAATIEKAKQDDPKELRKQIAELKRARGAPDAATVERAVAKAVGEAQAEWKRVEQENARAIQDLRGRLDKIAQLAVLNGNAAAIAEYKPIKARIVVDRPSPPPRRAEAAATGSSEVGTGGLRRILIALAQRPQGMSTRQIGVRAGLSSKSGSFNTYLSKARTNQWITGDRNHIQITDAGIEALGDFDPLPTGDALLQHWLRELGDSGASRILSALADAYPHELSKSEVAECAELSGTSGSFNTYLSRLRSLELIAGKGELKASDELFD